MGFSRQEYWSGLPFPSPGDLLDPGIEPRSPALQADALTSEPPEKPLVPFCSNFGAPQNKVYHCFHCFPIYLPWSDPIAAAAAKSLQSCPTLCDPIDGSPPGSPVPGILQARTLEWVSISFSNARKWKVKVKSLICVQLFATPWTSAYQAPLCPWDFPGKSAGVGYYFLLQI